MSPQRRLVRDLLWACIGPAIALVGGTLLGDDLTGYPRTFAITWFVLGVGMAALHYFNRDAPRQKA